MLAPIGRGCAGSLHLDGGALFRAQVASIRQDVAATTHDGHLLKVGVRAVEGGIGGKLILSKPEKTGSSFSVLGACVRTSCSSLAGCDKSHESRVDCGEPHSWPLDSSRSPSQLVLLVSSPASEPAFKGAGVADTVWASPLPSLWVLRTASSPGPSLSCGAESWVLGPEALMSVQSRWEGERCWGGRYQSLAASRVEGRTLPRGTSALGLLLPFELFADGIWTRQRTMSSLTALPCAKCFNAPIDELGSGAFGGLMN
ncbi:hypothetical protein MRX96_053538 [Rhipicephalus microplus]